MDAQQDKVKRRQELDQSNDGAGQDEQFIAPRRSTNAPMPSIKAARREVKEFRKTKQLPRRLLLQIEEQQQEATSRALFQNKK